MRTWSACRHRSALTSARAPRRRPPSRSRPRSSPCAGAGPVSVSPRSTDQSTTSSRRCGRLRRRLPSMTGTTTLGVSEHTHRRVAELARATGRQMQSIVEEAVSRYERALFWELFESGYERLARDKAGWAEVERERRAEAPALADGVG